MSTLSVYPQSTPELPYKVLTHGDDISATLAEVGVRFERRPATTAIVAGLSADEVLAAYRPQIEQLMGEGGYLAVDALSLAPDHPQATELRAAFLQEHSYAENQLCLFVAGRGLLSLHIGEQVFEVLCEKNDLVALPAGVRHWFDMGEKPNVVVIRLSSNPDGWVEHYSGDAIAEQFCRLEEWM